MLQDRLVDCQSEMSELQTLVERDVNTARTTIVAASTNATVLLSQVQKMTKNLSVQHNLFNDLSARLSTFPSETQIKNLATSCD